MRYFDLLVQHNWTFTRSISTVDSACSKIVYGHAQFTTENPHSILYTEQGFNNDTTHQAAIAFLMRYQYCFDQHPDEVIVKFAIGPNQGAVFHQFLIFETPQGWKSSPCLHHCDPDQYLSDYLYKKGQLTITHRVTGPAKNYRSVTQYQPLLTDAPTQRK